MGMLLTKALQQIETNKKKLAKKRLFILSYIQRFNYMRDPFEKDGGIIEVVRKEMQAVTDLEQSIIDLRKAIQKANEETKVTVGGSTKSIADWLIWKREIVAGQKDFVASIIRTIEKGRLQSENEMKKAEEGQREQYQQIVHVNEKEMHERSEQLEEIMGDLDAELSVRNATVEVDYGVDPE